MLSGTHFWWVLKCRLPVSHLSPWGAGWQPWAGEHLAFAWCFSPQSCACFAKEGFTREETKGQGGEQLAQGDSGSQWQQELFLPLLEALARSVPGQWRGKPRQGWPQARWRDAASGVRG